MKLISFGDYQPGVNPTEYSVTLQDIDSSDTGRGETGVMSRERVRAGIYKVTVTFKNISSDEVLNIKQAISPASVSVTLFDGDYVEADMFAGDRTLTLNSIDDNANCLWDMSFSMTEF